MLKMPGSHQTSLNESPTTFLGYAENAWKLSMFSGAELYVSRSENVGFCTGKPMACVRKRKKL
ncbi:hypothetical protein [Phocaeicola plebeius]